MITNLTFFVIAVCSAMCFFHYRDLYKNNRKGNNKTDSVNLKKSLNADFNTVWAMAELSSTDVEKAQVERLIEIFKKEYSHSTETRYNVQILQCINRMKNKKALKYSLELLN